jgi:hypothetical protein
MYFPTSSVTTQRNRSRSNSSQHRRNSGQRNSSQRNSSQRNSSRRNSSRRNSSQRNRSTSNISFRSAKTNSSHIQNNNNDIRRELGKLQVEFEQKLINIPNKKEFINAFDSYLNDIKNEMLYLLDKDEFKDGIKNILTKNEFKDGIKDILNKDDLKNVLKMDDFTREMDYIAKIHDDIIKMIRKMPNMLDVTNVEKNVSDVNKYLHTIPTKNDFINVFDSYTKTIIHDILNSIKDVRDDVKSVKSDMKSDLKKITGELKEINDEYITEISSLGQSIRTNNQIAIESGQTMVSLYKQCERQQQQINELNDIVKQLIPKTRSKTKKLTPNLNDECGVGKRCQKGTTCRKGVCQKSD